MQPLGSQLRVKGAGDIRHHAQQTALRIGSDLLVFVVVARGYLHLAGAVRAHDAIHLGKDAHFDSPIRREPQFVGDGGECGQIRPTAGNENPPCNPRNPVALGHRAAP